MSEGDTIYKGKPGSAFKASFDPDECNSVEDSKKLFKTHREKMANEFIEEKAEKLYCAVRNANLSDSLLESQIQVFQTVLTACYKRGFEDAVLFVAGESSAAINKIISDSNFDFMLGWVPKKDG